MSAPTFVRMKGDLAVSVPADLGCLTRYVILEQDDWCDDELAFVRRFLGPGMRALDAGAGYGVYALCAARAVGPTGRVVACEADAGARACLAESVGANDLPWTRVVASPADADAGPFDFVRAPATGLSPGLLVLLGAQAPLVLLEAPTPAAAPLALPEALAALGYAAFTLVPGLGRLVPLALGPGDTGRRHVFGCKPERAAALEAAGWLVTAPSPPATLGLWRAHLERFPYAAALRDTWSEYDASASEAGWTDHREALAAHAAACDESRPIAERWGALRRAGELLGALVKTAPNASRLQSCARVAAELGERQLACDLLSIMLAGIEDETFTFSPEPFVAVSAAHAGMDPEGDLVRWAVASLLAAHDELAARSSFDRGLGALDALEAIRDLGFQSPEMERRRQLVRLRFGLQKAPEAPLSTLPPSGDHLNTDFWTR